MAERTSTYHRRVAAEKRALILSAATALFLEQGYDRTSLARIAERSGVSRATLFKQFPTKADLFDAMITEAWSTASEDLEPHATDVVEALTTIGQHYADLLARPRMKDLFRIVIAELPRFPELARAQFTQGKMPYFRTLQRCLQAQHDAGALRIEDSELAATQFLGMISNHVFWPALLLPDWEVGPERATEVVDEAVRTVIARYATDPGGPPAGR